MMMIPRSFLRKSFDSNFNKLLTCCLATATSTTDLSGKVAIVTGASSGIGRSISLHLARAGLQVCLVARRKDELQQLKQQLTREKCRSCFSVCDVIDTEQVKMMVKKCNEELGEVDVLVNNAGVMQYTEMKSADVEVWKQMIDVNCLGTLNCIAAVLPGMINRGSGHIINMSSDAGRRGFAGLAAYSGSKFFVEGLSQGMRHEVSGEGIKVTCIQPGDVCSEISNHPVDTQAYKKYAVDQTFNKVLDCDDVARAVTFAISQPLHAAVNEILVEPTQLPI